MKIFSIFVFLILPFKLWADPRPPLWIPDVVQIGDTGTISRSYSPGMGIPESLGNIRLLSLEGGPATFGVKLGLGYMSEKKIINLSRGNFASNGKLKPADLNGEYLVYDRLNVEVPIGGKLSTGAGYIGGFLSFIVGGGREVIRKVRNSGEINKLSKAKVPFSVETLRKSLPRLGDKMAFFVEGGVTLGVMAMVNVAFDVGVRFLVRGKWGVSITRIGATRIKATLKTAKIKGVKILTTTLLTDVGVRPFENKLKHITFEYDLSQEKGVSLFQKFLKGKAIDSENFIRENPNTSIVASIKKGVFITKSKGFFARFSIPALFAVGSESTDEDVYSTEYQTKDNKYEQARFGIYKYQSYIDSAMTSNKIKKVPVGNVKRTKLFLGQVKEKKLKDNVKVGGIDYAANIKYQFKGTNYNKLQFKRELRRIIRWTGLEQEFKFDLPKREKHRFLQVDLDILISNHGMRDLISNFDKYKLSQWKELALIPLNNYFRSVDDPYGICPKKVGRLICRKYVKLRTKITMKKSYKIMGKMKKYLKNREMEKFTKSFAKLGKHILYNPFTYKTMLWVMRKNPMKAILTARGQDILYQQKIVPFYGANLK